MSAVVRLADYRRALETRAQDRALDEWERLGMAYHEAAWRAATEFYRLWFAALGAPLPNPIDDACEVRRFATPEMERAAREESCLPCDTESP